MKQLFFQSSLPRSGSTLLQNILGQNPDFYATPTSGVLELVFAARNNFTESLEFKAQDSETMKSAFRGFCRQGMLGYFDELTDKKYIIDKSRGWGYYQDFLKFFYPEAKIVCMIRDPRAIFSSMEKNYRKSPHKSNLLTKDSEMYGITTEQRIDIWASGQPVGIAFERLRQIIRQGNDKSMLFVKFEDLTKNPKKEMDRIYEYLEIPKYEDHDFNNITQITKEDDEVYGILGDHVIKPVVEPVKTDYNQILGTSASNWIRNNYSWFYEYFSYR